MTDTPGPWRRIDGEHYQRCGAYGARVWRSTRNKYRWHVYFADGPRELEQDSAPTLATAKRAATAALIRHAPMPF